MSFSTATLRTVLEAQVPEKATGIVVAVSGGADSAALLAATAALGPLRGKVALRAIHVDHGLQAAAAEFRVACAALCRRLDVPLTVISAVVAAGGGASIEAAAREARYGALEAELLAGECLLTAHHLDDQAATFLLQGLRGAGLKGLSAMPMCKAFGRGWHLRPVLGVPQKELLALHADSAGLASCDPMNQELRFGRVYLRRQVWPLIEARWPGAARALARAAGHSADAQGFLDARSAAAVARLRDGASLSVQGLRTLRAPERLHAVRYWLREAGVEPPTTVRLTEALRQMLEAEEDHLPVVIWGAHALRRYRQRLFVTAAEPPRLPATLRWAGVAQPLDLGPGLGTLRWTAHAGGIDAGRLPHTLDVRRREGGEALKPAAAARTQSLRHLCQSIGVLPWLREALPLVFADGELIAVADLWTNAPWCVAAPASGLALIWQDAPIIV